VGAPGGGAADGFRRPALRGDLTTAEAAQHDTEPTSSWSRSSPDGVAACGADHDQKTAAKTATWDHERRDRDARHRRVEQVEPAEHQAQTPAIAGRPTPGCTNSTKNTTEATSRTTPMI
jgi:hypothetical protein